jgi:hypothetical protein
MIFFSLASGSPSLAMLGAGAEDILVSGIDYTPAIWADGSGDLGLASGDAIDALCIADNGDGVFGRGDRVAYSLAPGSPTLTALGASPASILRPGAPPIVFDPEDLGLLATDNVDAMLCGEDFWPEILYAPIIYNK